MSSSTRDTSLPLSARLFCYLGPPLTILLASIASPRTGLISPLLFIPTALFFRKWRSLTKTDPIRRGDLRLIIWSYATIGSIGLALAGLAQMIICTATSTFLFGWGSASDEFWNEFIRSSTADLTANELKHRALIASSWQNWVFNGVFAFITAAFVEESVKYLPIAYVRRRGLGKPKEQQRDRAYIDYVLAGALSFGVVENIGFLYASCENGHETWPEFTRTLLERFVFGSVGHLLTATLTALRAIRRDQYGEQLSWWEVVGPSVIFHGAFDFVALSFSALEGNVGWIHPVGSKNILAMLVLLGSIVSMVAWLVRWNSKALNDRDRQRR